MATCLPIPASSSIQDISGQRFGRLTVLGYGGRKNSNHVWLCRCECGGEKLAQAGNMRSGLTQSCGCLQRQRASEAKRSKSLERPAKSYPEYKVWSEMNRRCFNEADSSFVNYGGRGISVCDRWRYGSGHLSAFECFIADMGVRPSPGHTLDRTDNDGPYSPDNCEWVSRLVQGRNKRNNKIITFQGRERLFVEVCEETGVPPSCAKQRLIKGWSVEDALTIPSKQPGKRKRRK